MLNVCPSVGMQELKKAKTTPISLETGHARTFGSVVWPGDVTLGVSEER